MPLADSGVYPTTGELEGILSKAKLECERCDRKEESNYPFGVIQWGDIEILCRVLTFRFPLVKGDPESDWRFQWSASPIGRRIGKGLRLNRTERYLSINDGFSLNDYESRQKFRDSIGELLSRVDDFEFFAPFQGSLDIDSRYFSFDSWDDKRSIPIFSNVFEVVGPSLQGGNPVLDLACGIGRLGISIEERHHCPVFFLDNNNKNIELIKGQYSLRGNPLPGSRLAVADSSEIGSAFPGIKFSIIFAIAFFEEEVIYTGVNQQKTLMSIYHQLVPGGHFIASGYMPLTINKKILEESGFVVERCSIPKNLFSLDLPKQMYIARKPE